MGMRPQEVLPVPPITSPVPSTRYSLVRTFMTFCMISKSLV